MRCVAGKKIKCKGGGMKSKAAKLYTPLFLSFSFFFIYFFHSFFPSCFHPVFLLFFQYFIQSYFHYSFLVSMLDSSLVSWWTKKGEVKFLLMLIHRSLAPIGSLPKKSISVRVGHVLKSSRSWIITVKWRNHLENRQFGWKIQQTRLGKWSKMNPALTNPPPTEFRL